MLEQRAPENGGEVHGPPHIAPPGGRIKAGWGGIGAGAIGSADGGERKAPGAGGSGVWQKPSQAGEAGGIDGGTGVDAVDGGEGNDTVVWRPGKGNDQLQGRAGYDVLRLEMTGLTLAQIREAITLDNGTKPTVEDGQLLLHGQAGTLTIGAETIRFAGFEQVKLSDNSPCTYGR